MEGDSVTVPIEYQVLPPICKHCHVFGHPTTQFAKKNSTSTLSPKCAKPTSTSSLPLQPANQEWIQVRNGKQNVAHVLSNQEKLGHLISLPTTLRPQQHSASIETSASLGEEQSDSEDELLEVLEGVVCSTEETNALKAAVSLDGGNIPTIPVINTDTPTSAPSTGLPPIVNGPYYGVAAKINTLSKAMQPPYS